MLPAGRVLQRKCACGGAPGPDGECAACKRKRLAAQRRAVGPGTPAAPTSSVNPALTGGQSLPPSARVALERQVGSFFSRTTPEQPPSAPQTAGLAVSQPGEAAERQADAAATHRTTGGAPYDFGRVRVHTDAQAVASARAFDALAYTVGHDIVFATGRYNPESTAGRELIAHELAHVVQQTRHGSERRQVQRLVDPDRVSCANTPRTYPIFTTIGTDDPVGVITDADALAIEMLTNTIDVLTDIRTRVIAGETPGWPLIGDALGESMRTRLRLNPDDPAIWTGTGPRTVEIVIRWLTNVRGVLQGGRVRYICIGPTCTAGDWARTIPGLMRIRLCRDFWRDTHDPLNGRALTLVHEASHIYYGTEDVGGGLGSAHCLEQFVSDANGVPVHPDFAASCPAPRAAP